MNASKKIRYLLPACLLALTSVVEAQTVEWWDPAGFSENLYDHPSNVSGIAQVEATPYGIYSVGRTDCVARAYDLAAICKGLITKYDADGRRVWRKRIKFRDSTQINALAVDDTGVYIYGTARWQDRHPSDTSFVQRYNFDGDLQWTFRDSQGNPKGFRVANIRAQALMLYDGHLYAASRRNQGSFLRKFSLDGQLEWLVPGETGSLAAGDGLIFSSSGPVYRRKGGEGLSIYDTDGNFQNRLFLRDVIGENGLAYHDGALYYCTHGRDNEGRRSTYGLHKVWLDGTTAWQVDWGKTDFPDTEGCSVSVDDDRVTFAGNLRLGHRDTFDANLTVRRFSLDGEELSRLDFPSLVAVPNSVSVLADEVYLAGWDLESGKGFTGRVSDAPTLPPTMVMLQGAGSSEPGRLAILDHHYGAGPVSALTRDLPASDAGDLVQFSANLRPVDFLRVPDINGNGHDELAILSKRPAVAEIVDSHTGVLLNHIDLNQKFEPVAAAAHDGVLAVLTKHHTKPYVRVQEFDAKTGASISSTPFNPNYAPIDLYAVPPGAGRRYAVLSVNTESQGRAKLEVRDVGGALVNNIWLGPSITPLRGLVYDDLDETRIAVLRRHRDRGWTDLVVVDPGIGIVDTLQRNRQFSAGPMVFSPDIDLNNAEQFTFAGQNDAGDVRAETRDLGSGGLLHNVYLHSSEIIQDVLYLGTESGVSTPTLALLLRDDLEEIESRYRVIMLDLLTGTRTDEWYFRF